MSLPSETSHNTLSVLKFLPATILIGGGGWIGIFWLLLNTLPTVGPRWFFFFCCFLALSGTFLPLVVALNRRFPNPEPTLPHVIIRQANWIGIYGTTLLWLQLGRIVTPALALLLAIGLLLMEWLLQLREKSQRKI